MTHHTSHLRLHMGCGEALRSQWLQSVTQPERKPSSVQARKQGVAKHKRERMRG